jgi:ketosteroid isomerase-like protein
MRKSVLSLVVVVSLAAGCSGSRPTDEFTMKDQASIRERSDTLVKAFNDKSVDRILDVYTESSVFMPPNEPIIRGKDALKMFYEDLLKGGAANLKLQVSEVSGQGPLAYQSGSYEMERSGPSAGSGRDRGKYLFVLRKFNDTWRYEYAMWNSDLPSSANP